MYGTHRTVHIRFLVSKSHLLSFDSDSDTDPDPDFVTILTDRKPSAYDWTISSIGPDMLQALRISPGDRCNPHASVIRIIYFYFQQTEGRQPTTHTR
jgi:hypothetical protein